MEVETNYRCDPCYMVAVPQDFLWVVVNMSSVRRNDEDIVDVLMIHWMEWHRRVCIITARYIFSP